MNTTGAFVVALVVVLVALETAPKIGALLLVSAAMVLGYRVLTQTGGGR